MVENILVFSPKLRKVGNLMALLNHVADYTTRELDPKMKSLELMN